MADSVGLEAILNRLETGKHLSKQDLQTLVTAVRSQQVTITTGDRAVAIGGSADGAVIVTGDRNIVVSDLNLGIIQDLKNILQETRKADHENNFQPDGEHLKILNEQQSASGNNNTLIQGNRNQVTNIEINLKFVININIFDSIRISDLSSILSNRFVSKSEEKQHKKSAQECAMESQYNKIRQRLLSLVQRECSTRLKHSVFGEVMIELNSITMPEMAPGRIDSQPLQKEQIENSAEEFIRGAFDRLDSTLLILGEPGSGKTVTLLNLALNLSRNAEQLSTKPIPIMLNLHSWSCQDIFDWAAGEMTSHYGISNELTSFLIKRRMVILLLDGLDETRDRELCIQKINEFHRKYTEVGIVVCSRLIDYKTSSILLQFENAICLQNELTQSQINHYIFGNKIEFTHLRNAIQENSELRNLAKSPLFLSILILGNRYANQKQEITIKTYLDAYIERMLSRPADSSKYPEIKQIKYWLSWLAICLEKESKSEFCSKDLWFCRSPNFRQNKSYELLVKLASVLTFGMAQVHIQHLIFRLDLWRNGYAPLNYTQFLDYCADRLLLQRVGGRYRFIHRLLQEHFAAMLSEK